jgi:hypothetical protein
MPHQASIFPEDEPALSPQGDPNPSPGTAMALSALKFSSVQLSPAQKRFNQLLTQTETLTGKIEATRQVTDTHRSLFASRIPPLEKEHAALMRRMAVWLDERLQRKGLTDKQKRIAREIICNLSAGLAMQGDEAMQALHDAHSSHSLADEEQAATLDLQQAMEDVFGESLGEGDTPFQSMDDLMRAAAQKMQASNAAREEAKTQRNAKKKKSAAQRKSEDLAAAQAQDADGALRTLYRQLASALHPDRETDPQEQLRKTVLMKEANAAYERRDLLALLQLQLRADLADGDKVATMAKEKLAALTALLKERVAVLTRELYVLERRALHEFDLPPYSPFSEAVLKRHLVMQQQNLQADIAMMQQDLARVQEGTHFKRWLKQQHELARDDFDPSEFF